MPRREGGGITWDGRSPTHIKKRQESEKEYGKKIKCLPQPQLISSESNKSLDPAPTNQLFLLLLSQTLDQTTGSTQHRLTSLLAVFCPTLDQAKGSIQHPLSALHAAYVPNSGSNKRLDPTPTISSSCCFCPKLWIKQKA